MIETKKDTAQDALHARFTRSTLDFYQRAAKLAARFESGEIDALEWYRLFDKLVLTGHSVSWSMGRKLAGDTSDQSEIDVIVGIAKRDEESAYLLGFLEDLQNTGSNLYDADGVLKLPNVQNRANLYGKKLRGTANEAFVATSPNGDEFNWILGPNEEHCLDCPRMPAMNPFTLDTLPFYPGDGSTACLSNCHCHLVRGDGVVGFKRVDP